MKRPVAIASLCFALTVAAWIVDLLTPQLFVAAILLNGPIALSALALDTRITYALVIFAELANIVAGYVNGVQTNYHWDPIALGDRVLSGASFLLVGFLTARAQEYARDAGTATERARIAAGEKALRRSLEAVRASLNVDLVLRAIVRETLCLVEAEEAMLIVRGSALQTPDVYTIARGSEDSSIERIAPDPATSSLFQRAMEEPGVVLVREDDPVARMALERHGTGAAAAVRIFSTEYSVVLFVFADTVSRETQRLLRAYAEGASVALEQARLFMQLGFRNEQIAAQKDALEDRNRVIRDIVYALAHDLRTPLSAANVTMQQALDGAYGDLPEPYRHVLQTALASNADQRRLVETLLLVARFESGETSTLREDIDVGTEASRVVEEIRPIADVKGVHLRVEQQESGTISGDASEFRRAIANLIANAVEATPAGGNVDVRVERDGKDTRVTVCDDGFGVPPEQRERLFQRFASNGRALGAGTGLGLYIVRLIAEKFGGRAWFAPREPHGSIFTLQLPLAEKGANG